MSTTFSRVPEQKFQAVLENRPNKDADPPVGAKRNLPSVTALRFFATAFILFYHGSELFGFEKRNGLDYIGLWQGLTCFFVLSGFILTYVHPKLADNAAVIKFMGARFARIWPSYATAIAVFILAFLPSILVPGALTSLIACLTMTQAWILDRTHFSAFNTPGWSLSIEMFFYICFPFLVRSLNTTWRWKLAASIFLSLSCVVLCTLQQFPDFPSFGNSAAPLINICPFSRQFEFVIGMLGGLVFLNTQQLQLSKWKGTALECLALLGVLFALCLPKLWQLDSPWHWLSAFRCWVIYSGIAPAYAVLVYFLAQQFGAISKYLANRPLIFLGELSFSLFLFHFPVYVFLAQDTHILQGRPAWLAMSIWLACTFVVAVINYKLIEVPCRKRILSAISNRLAGEPAKARAD